MEIQDAVPVDDNPHDRLNMAVAVTVAVLATFMGICKVKDDNLCQAMQAAQANKLDHWNFYQARNIREEVARSTLVQIKLGAGARPANEQAPYNVAIATYQQVADAQEKKKNEEKDAAEQSQKEYDALNYRDDQFDLSDTLLAIAISLLAVTALTRQRWLFVAALVPIGFGVLMGLAGLFGWAVHPTALIAMLS